MRTTRVRTGALFFWVFVVLDVLAVVLLGLVLAGVFVKEPPVPAPPSPPGATAPASTTPASTTRREAAPATEERTSAVAAASTRRGQTTRVVVRAVRGDCWVSARAGSPQGKVLYADVLREGSQMTVSARKVWLELGAAGNVVVTVDGRARQVAPGTTAFLLS